MAQSSVSWRKAIAAAFCAAFLLWTVLPSSGHLTKTVLADLVQLNSIEHHGHSHDPDDDLFWDLHGHPHDQIDHDHNSFSLSLGEAEMLSYPPSRPKDEWGLPARPSEPAALERPPRPRVIQLYA